MIKGIYEDLGKLGGTKYKRALIKFDNWEELAEEELKLIEGMKTKYSIYQYLRAIVRSHRWYRFNIENILDKGCYYVEEIKGLIELLVEQDRVEDLRRLENRINSSSRTFIANSQRFDKETLINLINLRLEGV